MDNGEEDEGDEPEGLGLGKKGDWAAEDDMVRIGWGRGY